MPFLIFSIPLFFLLRKDIKWRKNYLNYKSNQNQKREDELLKLQENEKIEDEKTEKRKQMLLTEPSYISIKEINLKHPTLEETASIISDLETNFYKKWGITSEEKSDENVSEKVLNFLKKGEMINATIAYKNENNLTSTNEARKKINKIAKDFKYKL